MAVNTFSYDSSSMIVSERVQDRMNAAGLSQSELARRVGVSQPTIYKLLRTSKRGSAHLHRIARELGTTPAYLSGETDDPTEDAPTPADLDSEAREMIDRFVSLTPADRRALLQVARSLAGQEAHATLQDRSISFSNRTDP